MFGREYASLHTGHISSGRASRGLTLTGSTLYSQLLYLPVDWNPVAVMNHGLSTGRCLDCSPLCLLLEM